MQDQHLRFRRRVPTVGEQPPNKNRFTLILGIATAAVIVPALVYTAMHPAAVSSTVKQIARHMPAQVKEMHVAVLAPRSTPTPQPTPTATAAPTVTPAAKPKTPSAAELEHLAHLQRAHALAAAAAHTKKLASNGQTSDFSTSASGAQTSSNLGGSNSTSTVPASATATAAPAGVAEAPAQQQPVADATPVYAPDLVVDARFTHEVQPDYPEVARIQSAQGTAVVLATIGPHGNVISARIDQSTGNKLLDNAALAAARESGFEPPKINGKPATETYRLVYTFAL